MPARGKRHGMLAWQSKAVKIRSMSKFKKNLDPDESKLFRDAMRNVKPLTHTKIHSESRKPSIRLRRRHTEPSETTGERFEFSDYEKLPPVDSETFLEFSRAGLQHKMLRKLRLGQYNAEAFLDLHGQTIDEARESLAEFLLQCQQDGLRHVVIIHGKGRHDKVPILKNKLNHWLRQTPQVIAFCTATLKDGGTGAVYVLLKK